MEKYFCDFIDGYKGYVFTQVPGNFSFTVEVTVNAAVIRITSPDKDLNSTLEIHPLPAYREFMKRTVSQNADTKDCLVAAIRNIIFHILSDFLQYGDDEDCLLDFELLQGEAQQVLNDKLHELILNPGK